MRRLVVSAAALVVPVAAAAQDAGSLLPGEWVQIFRGVDLSVMAAIAVIAYVLERSDAISDRVAMLVPLALGTVWGITEALSATHGSVAVIAKGALLNGGGASFVARLLHALLNRYWDQPPPAQP